LLRWSTASRAPWWAPYVAPIIVVLLTVALLGFGHVLGWGTALAGLFLAAPGRTIPTPQFATAPVPETLALESERAQLQLEISQLREELLLLQQSLSGQNHFAQLSQDYQLASAPVLYRDPTRVIPSFIIHLGSQQGVRVGQPVLGQVSVIGRVSAVWPGRARVDLLSKPGIAFGAIVQNSRALGVVESNAGQLELSFLAKGTSVNSGDAIVTSGVPGYTPPGLPLGIVETVSDSGESLTLQVTLMPLENPWTLSVVQVVLMPPVEGDGGTLSEELSGGRERP